MDAVENHSIGREPWQAALKTAERESAAWAVMAGMAYPHGYSSVGREANGPALLEAGRRTALEVVGEYLLQVDQRMALEAKGEAQLERDRRKALEAEGETWMEANHKTSLAVERAALLGVYLMADMAVRRSVNGIVRGWVHDRCRRCRYCRYWSQNPSVPGDFPVLFCRKILLL